MKSRTILCAFALVCGWSGVASAAPWDKPGWTLTFQDEFDGTGIDSSRWIKRFKWGEGVINNELQAYVDDAFVLKSGILSIVAQKKPGSYAGKTFDYRSGLLSSKHEQLYGYFEMRAKFPKGKGYWPAFWLLNDPSVAGVHEIDIHEFLGHEVDTLYTTVHWGTDYGAGHKSKGSSFVGPDFTAGFHTFAVEWDASRILWFVDGAQVFQHTGDGVPQNKLYIIANLAVGGSWPGSPDSSTVFPGSYEIDYIRAYQRTADAGADAAPDSPSDTGTGKDTGKDAPVDTGKDTAADTAKDTAVDAVNEAGKDSAVDALSDALADSHEDSQKEEAGNDASDASLDGQFDGDAAGKIDATSPADAAVDAQKDGAAGDATAVVPSEASSSDDSGCNCRTSTKSERSVTWGWLALLGLWGLVCRRARRNGEGR